MAELQRGDSDLAHPSCSSILQPVRSVVLQRYIGRLQHLLERSGGDAASEAGQEIEALVTMRVRTQLCVCCNNCSRCAPGTCTSFLEASRHWLRRLKLPRASCYIHERSPSSQDCVCNCVVFHGTLPLPCSARTRSGGRCSAASTGRCSPGTGSGWPPQGRRPTPASGAASWWAKLATLSRVEVAAHRDAPKQLRAVCR